MRLALGSAPREVARIVLMRGLVLAAIGVSAGVALTRSGHPGLRCRVFRHRLERQRDDLRGGHGGDVRDCARRLVGPGGSRGSHRASGGAAR